MSFTKAEITNGTGFASDARFEQVTEEQRTEALSLAQSAQDCAYGDSNDEEIEQLRDALDYALSLLGLELPAGNDPNDDD